MKKFGFDEPEWETAKQEGKGLLGEYARRRQMVPYSEFVGRLNTISFEPHDFRLDQFLGEISREESEAGRGMLSALVVHKRGDLQPGRGFFRLAEELGHDTGDVVKFWIEEVKRVFAAWQKEDEAVPDGG